jgi:hypothetical protein
MREGELERLLHRLRLVAAGVESGIVSELERLRALVKDFASSEPEQVKNDYGWGCPICYADSEDVGHYLDCAWLRAVEEGTV